jgi:hypothetical protein
MKKCLGKETPAVRLCVNHSSIHCSFIRPHLQSPITFEPRHHQILRQGHERGAGSRSFPGLYQPEVPTVRKMPIRFLPFGNFDQSYFFTHISRPESFRSSLSPRNLSPETAVFHRHKQPPKPKALPFCTRVQNIHVDIRLCTFSLHANWNTGDGSC